MAVTFTYDVTINPAIFYVRLLIADTDPEKPIFGDDEIQGAFTIQASVYQSSQFYSRGATGRSTLASSPVSYLRVAALLLDAIAANKARLSSITQLLDVKLSPDKAAASLREQADRLRSVEDDSGAFAIIEQCPTSWTFLDRFYKTIQRQNAGT
jgi:hypothetical protein